jgi:hypothetical protein
MKKDFRTSLGLINPKHIEISPDRPNIFFSSLPRPDREDDKLQVDPSTYINSSDCRILLIAERFDFPLTLVYGNLQVIGECFLFASNMMGPLQYESVQSSKHSVNRLFTQFHAQHPEHERERIILYRIL